MKWPDAGLKRARMIAVGAPRFPFSTIKSFQRKTLSDFSERVHQVGNDLLSRRCSIIGVQGLTAVFGMGTGGTPALYSPTVPSDAVRRRLA